MALAQDLENVEEGSALDQLIPILLASSTLKADVELLILDQDGRELQENQAHLVMQKPDHFYWEISAPYEELRVINGVTSWFYEPDLDQVTIQAFENDLGSLPFLLLNGDEESIKAAYTISSMRLAEDNSYQRFVLIPTDPGSLFERLSLTFIDAELVEMLIEDSVGQKSSLTFSNVEINISVDPGLFEFIIPEGVDVIDTTAIVLDAE